jgi:hypothetical protein
MVSKKRDEWAASPVHHPDLGHGTARCWNESMKLTVTKALLLALVAGILPAPKAPAPPPAPPKQP